MQLPGTLRLRSGQAVGAGLIVVSKTGQGPASAVPNSCHVDRRAQRRNCYERMAGSRIGSFVVLGVLSARLKSCPSTRRAVLAVVIVVLFATRATAIAQRHLASSSAVDTE